MPTNKSRADYMRAYRARKKTEATNAETLASASKGASPLEAQKTATWKTQLAELEKANEALTIEVQRLKRELAQSHKAPYRGRAPYTVPTNILTGEDVAYSAPAVAMAPDGTMLDAMGHPTTVKAPSTPDEVAAYRAEQKRISAILAKVQTKKEKS